MGTDRLRKYCRAHRPPPPDLDWLGVEVEEDDDDDEITYLFLEPGGNIDLT